MADTNSVAEHHKQLGNSLFARQEYVEAIDEYSKATSHHPNNPILFTNRAICHLKLRRYDHVLMDADHCLCLDQNNIKGWCYKGLALLESETYHDRIQEAVNCFRKAYLLATPAPAHPPIKNNPPPSNSKANQLLDDIIKAYYRARKKKWEILETKRKKEESEFYGWVRQKILDECSEAKTLLHSTLQNGNQTSLADYEFQLSQLEEKYQSKLLHFDSIYAHSFKPISPSSIPDFIMCKISMEIMVDPVVTPSGITYDRHGLYRHMERVGWFDPFTRTSIKPADIIPNLALKEFIDQFLDR